MVSRDLTETYKSGMGGGREKGVRQQTGPAQLQGCPLRG